jgi:hypothetical protein
VTSACNQQCHCFRVRAGSTNGRVYRKAENPNDVVILVNLPKAALVLMSGQPEGSARGRAKPFTVKELVLLATEITQPQP